MSGSQGGASADWSFSLGFGVPDRDGIQIRGDAPKVDPRFELIKANRPFRLSARYEAQMWADGTAAFLTAPCRPCNFGASALTVFEQQLGDLGRAINHIVRKIKRGGNGFNRDLCPCVVSVKEVME
jgi:hypothetical protein